jgi:hypothetical protein
LVHYLVFINHPRNCSALFLFSYVTCVFQSYNGYDNKGNFNDIRWENVDCIRLAYDRLFRGLEFTEMEVRISLHNVTIREVETGVIREYFL